MDKWDELRTAHHLARLGTVSAAADALGIHRATVARHIDTLEATLGARLFQRHGRGYTLTDAGREMAQVASATEEQLTDLASRIRDQVAAVTGEVIVTSVEILAPLVLPALSAFQLNHPDTNVRYEASARLFKLEYGEAHVAIRAGPRPEHPDNVVRPLPPIRSALYAHRSYIERNGLPSPADGFSGHNFVDGSTENTHLVSRWLRDVVPDARVVFASGSERLRTLALKAGMGISFYPTQLARRDPALVQVHPPREEWEMPLWLVTHVDLHRTAKVRAMSEALLTVTD